MSASQLTRIAFVGVFVTLSAAIDAFAQPTVVADSVSGCDYRVCALTIAPRWNGLAIVRGTSGATIANLGFFMPHDISAELGANDRRAIGSDSVGSAARRALHLRRIGAVLTDAGLAAMIFAGARGLTSAPDKRTNLVVAAAGAGVLGLSVPFQFGADGALSRAVWWHNLRYAGTPSRQ